MSSLHSRSYLFNFNLRIQYCRGIAAFQSCCPKFSQKIQVLEIAILFGFDDAMMCVTALSLSSCAGDFKASAETLRLPPP